MVSDVTLYGMLYGLGINLVSNGIRKQPLMSHPWEHLIAMGVGAFFTNKLVKWNAQLQIDLEKKIEAYKTANRRRHRRTAGEDVTIGLQDMLTARKE